MTTQAPSVAEPRFRHKYILIIRPSLPRATITDLNMQSFLKLVGGRRGTQKCYEHEGGLTTVADVKMEGPVRRNVGT